MLEPIVGRDNLRATVTAEIDFSQTEATSEEFKPNQGADASVSVRSQQTTEPSSGAGSTPPSGVPGAASQPAAGRRRPRRSPARRSRCRRAPPAAPRGGGGRREAVTNYEVDKTVRVTRNATGNVKRLNAAVVVNHRSVTDAKGKTTQHAARPADEIEKLTALVQRERSASARSAATRSR